MNSLPLLVPLAALVGFIAPGAQAEELRTPTYVIRITENCPEGEVG